MLEPPVAAEHAHEHLAHVQAHRQRHRRLQAPGSTPAAAATSASPQARARAASSAAACGTPNRISAPSPMNLSITPPWRSAAVRHHRAEPVDEAPERFRRHRLRPCGEAPHVDEQHRHALPPPAPQRREVALGQRVGELRRQVAGEVEPPPLGFDAPQEEVAPARHRDHDHAPASSSITARTAIGGRLKNGATLAGIAGRAAGSQPAQHRRSPTSAGEREPHRPSREQRIEAQRRVGEEQRQQPGRGQADQPVPRKLHVRRLSARLAATRSTSMLATTNRPRRPIRPRRASRKVASPCAANAATTTIATPTCRASTGTAATGSSRVAASTADEQDRRHREPDQPGQRLRPVLRLAQEPCHLRPHRALASPVVAPRWAILPCRQPARGGPTG